ncbi:MAG: pyridoxamine 5'-phosphate oxidase family protein [Acidimicrobiales bacterium]|jgi:nitroimidazol reductase NimA-like FMN-containing flavoprotein (pyridoxamine 5'-phosphate oxidase superfamily)
MADVEGGRGDGAGPTSDRVRLRRLPDQGSYRTEDLHRVLDAGFVCHLGVVVDGWPMVVPTTYARAGDHLVVHGSAASRSLRTARTPVPVCVTVTLVDGLVLARSVFNHSVNYRCAMVYGLPELVDDTEGKLAGLEAISEHVAPGQWSYARPPSDKELAATTVLRLSLAEASVKISEGPPDDDPADLGLDLWAGEVPLRTVRLDPVAAPDLDPAIGLPGHLASGPLAPGSQPARRPG